MMLEKGALTGITVLDLSRLLPGPFGSMILADHGARVIGIEDKRFLADNLFFLPANRNKEHISLNLKTDQGREIFFRLVEMADVVIEGFRPGVVQRLGVDFQTLRRVNPRIVYCSVSGYGQTGRFRDKAGHDVNYLGYAGVLDLVGEADRPPAIPGVQFADMVGGGMNAVIGILLALIARERTGKGQYIDISMTDGMVSLLPAAKFFQEMTGATPRRGRWILSHRYACYNTYETADGRSISIGALENRFWQRLCDHFGMPHLGPLQFDEARRTEIIDRLRETFRSKTLAQWEAELTDLDICFGGVRNMDEVYGDPLFREREMVVEIDGPDGKPYTALGVPVKLSDTPGAVRTVPVEFGGSTLRILEELGYTTAQIAEFGDAGAI